MTAAAARPDPSTVEEVRRQVDQAAAGLVELSHALAADPELAYAEDRSAARGRNCCCCLLCASFSGDSHLQIHCN